MGYEVKIEANEGAWVRALAAQGVTDAQRYLAKMEYPTVPPADLACSKPGVTVAVEVKFFKRAEKKAIRFYEGLDEAAGLLLQPYDYVVLWHVFDETYTTVTIEKEALRHIEKILKNVLPIGYECRQLAHGQLKSIARIEAPKNRLKHG